MLEYVRHTKNEIVGAALSSSQETEGFPLGNLKHPSTSVDCRLLNEDPTDVQVDFGSSKEFDVFALIGHNLTSSSEVGVYGGASPNPGTLLWNVDWKKHDSLVYLEVPISHRYLKIRISDPANPSPILQLGNIVVGVRVTTEILLQLDYEISKRYVENFTPQRSGAVEVEYLTRKKSQKVKTGPLLLSEMDSLKTLVDELEGTERVLWIFDEDRFFAYGLMDAEFERQFGAGPRVQTDISVTCSPRAIVKYPTISSPP